jgi:hypothetical protein
LTVGSLYRKVNIFPDITKNEQQSSLFFDPICNEIFSFHKEDNDEYVNDHDNINNTLTITSRTITPLLEMPAWLKTKIRHVFLQRTRQPDATYEYLGTSLDETVTRNPTTGIIVSCRFDIRI